MPTLDRARRPLSRRTAVAGASGLGGVLAVLAVTGCDVSLDPSPADPTIDPDRSPGVSGAATEPATEPDADVALVAAVAAATERTRSALAASVRRHPRLRAGLAPLERLHHAHLGELGPAEVPSPGGDQAGGAAGESTAAALRRVLAAEAGLQRTLTRAAARASSGALALLLASMAASLAQHRAGLGASGGDAT